MDKIDAKLIDKVYSYLKSGAIIYAIGNGGSSSEASHLIAELIGRFRENRAPIKAVSLIDSAVITCISNDFGYDNIFSRQLEALLEKKDILISFTTSGKSKNILKALDVANNKNCLSICFCGKDISKLDCDCILSVNSEYTDEIQEVHIKLVHEFVDKLEKRMKKDESR